MNSFSVGFDREIIFPKRDFLYIGDEIPHIPRARVFDLGHHYLNPLKDIDHKRARQLAEVLYTLYPQGENTLTVRNGKRILARHLLNTTRLDKIHIPDDELQGLLSDLFLSPVLKRVLCHSTNFSFNPQSIVLVRLNRAELGDFDTLALGLVVLNHYQGQVVLDDLGFFGRDAHVSLIRENRLIAGVNTLSELPPRLRHAVLGVKDITARGALYDDAELLAKYAGFRPDPLREDSDYNNFVRAAMQRF